MPPKIDALVAKSAVEFKILSSSEKCERKGTPFLMITVLPDVLSLKL